LKSQLLGSLTLLLVKHLHPDHLDCTQILTRTLFALDGVFDGSKLSRKIDRLGFMLLDQVPELGQLLVAEP
jgi:hypothetical protein